MKMRVVPCFVLPISAERAEHYVWSRVLNDLDVKTSGCVFRLGSLWPRMALKKLVGQMLIECGYERLLTYLQGVIAVAERSPPSSERYQNLVTAVVASDPSENASSGNSSTHAKDPIAHDVQPYRQTNAHLALSESAALPSSAVTNAPPIIGAIDQGAGFNSGITSGDEDSCPRPVALPGKEGIVYPGSDVIYPAGSIVARVEDDNPSPEYSTFDPNGRAPTVTTHDAPPPSSSHTSSHESSEGQVHSHRKSFDIAAESLDADGFTAEERAEHNRTIRHLQKIRVVTYTRFFLRTLTIITTSIALILSVIVIDHFHKATKAHSLPPGMSLRPTSIVASFGGISMLISMALLILCSFVPRLRKITKMSNAIFAIISLIGVTSWLGSCMYLYHGRGKGRNLWYYTCTAVKAYHAREAAEGGLSRRSDSEDAIYDRLDRMCHMTNAAWGMAVTVAVIEILTLVNVVAAIVLLKGSFLKLAIKDRRITIRS